MLKLKFLAAVLPLLFLAWVFLKIGVVFFGGGFLLIPLIHHDVVQHLHWLDERQFVDGVALSQLTPGPIAVLATFCGFHYAGIPGAVIATLAVWLPAFVLMIFISIGYGKVKKNPSVEKVLNNLTPAIIGLLAATALQIGVKSIVTPLEVVVMVAALFVMIRWKISPALLIAASAALGLIMHQ